MSYRAGVPAANLEEASKIADEMMTAAGWDQNDTWEEAAQRDAYRDGVIDATLRAAGYDVFG